MAEKLDNELVSFGFNNIIDVNRASFRKKLADQNILKELQDYNHKFLDFYNDFPEFGEEGGFSDDLGMVYYDIKNEDESERIKPIVKNFDGGDKQFILDCLAKKEWMLKFIEERIESMLGMPSNLSDFGEWNNLDNPQFFILKNNGILSCLLSYFDKINRKNFPINNQVYSKLFRILFKSDGKPYSQGTFKKTKERYSDDNENNKDQVIICNQKNLNEKRCVHFLNYILNYDLEK